MSRKLIPLAVAVAGLFLWVTPSTNATFSIVAVDTVNGIIGGAGASCIANSHIINDIIESVGAVHTQAYWLQANKTYAHLLLSQGLTPDSIIALLILNDAENFPQYRQYGVVTLAGPGASAAFTGYWTDSWADHLTGPGYAIQGNILLGQEVLDDMETAFTTTDGPLEKRLMAALEAAKRPGADTRCLGAGKSAISAFVKVVRPGDGATPFLYQVVPSTTGSTDPIDVLRAQFDTWALTQSAHPDSSTVTVTRSILSIPNLATTEITVTPKNWAGEKPVQLDSIVVTNSNGGIISALTDNGNGTFSATLTAPVPSGIGDTITVEISAYYGIMSELTVHPVIKSYRCGDANADGTRNVADLTYLVGYLFRGGPAPVIPQVADNNQNGAVNVADITYMVSYLFGGGLPPCGI